ncbi:MAG: sigma-70 family RNA polymerase sigma factor [Elusimicrobia bacterium]|nr:sigma-70 family RNA polymerase sigma factor [Elusimicrobiota bacterium]
MSVKGKAHARPIEGWEVELAKNVARSFAGFPEWNDLEAELFRKLSVIKSGKREGIKDWKAFLAKSLFNSAHDYIRRWKAGAKLFQPMEIPGKDGEMLSLEEIIAHPGDPKDSGIDIRLAVESLSPELQELWALLMEEGGNQVRVAERLGKPRMTVKYWIDKLKSSLVKRGF